MMRKRTMIGGEVDYKKQPLTIVSLSNNNTISFLCNGSSEDTMSIYVSTDKVNWTLVYNTSIATLSTGQKLYVKKHPTYNATSYATDSSIYNYFTSTGSFAIEGNIMSLLYNDFENQTALPDGEYTFCGLFRDCTLLENIDNLVMPATTLMPHCYRTMFRGCSGLTSIPDGLLPATTMVASCYYAMFYYCSGLTTVPSGLLPATTLADTCYRGMFSRCTSLRTTPELPATTLAAHCYQNLFYYDSNVNYIKCLATNISATQCVYGWCTNVAASGTFVKAASMTKWSSGTGGIPSGWTVQNAS